MGVFALMFYSCELETELEVENHEAPTSLEIGTEATADKLFHSWFNTLGSYDGPALIFNTMADQTTMSHGNQGMRDMSSEPRIGWNNSSTYSFAVVTENYFNSLHAILADANAIAAGIVAGSEFSDVDKYESLSRFGQGAAIGSLALVFDRVFISDETGTLNNGEAVGYQEAIQFALEKLDLAIAAADRGDFDLTDDFVYGKDLSSDEWSEFLNSLAARILVNSARNSAQRASLDWNRVLAYANNGLTYDFAIGGDGFSQWWPEHIYYSILGGWGRTDMRLINFMDPEYPDYWPASETTLPPAESEDARLESDFQYLAANTFAPDRGTYHFSSYRHKRYDEYLNLQLSDLNEMLQAENELYKAEAHLRLGNLTEAANAINSSSRVLRGELPPVAADADAIAEAIHYERMIELMNTGLGLGYYEMRGTDNLQAGTPLHFPVPGAALDAAGLPGYTFGGSTGTPGEDYSDAGWR